MAMLFPPWYSNFVCKNTECRQLDPFLVWAVMRQESIFNASIISPAGAVGLMQIMPATGKVIAKALGENYSPDSLNSPEANVRFGAYYIKELLDEFDGNIVLAAASYNGGPFNAKKWLSLNRNDGFNMFVEGIGFSETRDYVKKVVANYWTYALLARKGAYDKKYAPWFGDQILATSNKRP